MIPYQQVLDEIERQLQQARNTQSPSEMREALAAIRALSEVALSGEKQKRLYPRKAHHSPVAPPQPQSLSSLDAKPLEEEDGSNGSSIFDF